VGARRAARAPAGERPHPAGRDRGDRRRRPQGSASASGRFDRCLPFAGYRAGAYRVHEELLERWGGLGVRDGYVQRSARLPELARPERFLAWLDAQRVDLLARNN